MDILNTMYRNVHSTFWSEKFWFPHNASWADLENTNIGPHKDVYHPQVSDLLGAIPATIALLILRYVIERIVIEPLARLCGMQNKHARRPEPQSTLEAFFKRHKRPSFREMESLAKALNWTTRRVERWFRIKRNHKKSCGVKKFCEAGWRFLFYFCAFLYGVHVLHDEDFSKDWRLTRAMGSWPHHHIKDEFYLYYMVEIGFYFSLCVTMLTDVRRSDFLQMTVHHLLTIALLVFSWTINFVRIGLLILLLHDSADYWLEAAKLTIYLKKEKLSFALILLFAGVWIFTRVYLYPVHIVYPSWVEYVHWYFNYGHCYSVLTILSFLLCLVVLNLIWTYFILKTIFQVVTKGDSKDARSDSELSDVSSEEIAQKNGHMQNGVIKKHQ